MPHAVEMFICLFPCSVSLKRGAPTLGNALGIQWKKNMP